MRLLQLMFLCTFVIYLLSIAISEHSCKFLNTLPSLSFGLSFAVYHLNIFYHYCVDGVNALEGKHKGVGKVKCKEQVDEALRKYFDKGKEIK